MTLLKIIIDVYDYGKSNANNDSDFEKLFVGVIFGAIITLIVNIIMYYLNTKRDNLRLKNKLRAELIQDIDKITISVKYIEYISLISFKYNRLWNIDKSNVFNKEYATTFQNNVNDKVYDFEFLRTEFIRKVHEFIFLQKLKIVPEELTSPLYKFQLGLREESIFSNYQTAKDVEEAFKSETKKIYNEIDKNEVFIILKKFKNSLIMNSI